MDSYPLKQIITSIVPKTFMAIFFSEISCLVFVFKKKEMILVS